MRKDWLYGIVLILLSCFVYAAEYDNGTLFYNWESGSGNLTDRWGSNTGNVTSMTFTGDVPTFNISGNNNFAGDFDGVNDYAHSISNITVETSKDFSVCWWKNAAAATQNTNPFGTTRNEGGYSFGYIMVLENLSSAGACQGRTNFRIEGVTNGNAGMFCQTDVNIYDDQYHHECVVYDTSEDSCSWYVDGINRTTAFIFGSCNLVSENINGGGNNGKWYLGKTDLADGDYNKMKKDNFRIFQDRAITSQEVRNLYNYGSLIIPPTPSFTVTATNAWNGSTINSFSANVSNSFINNNPTIVDNAVSAWNFNENFVDYEDSISNNHGSCSNCPTFTTNTPFNEGYEFDGTNDRIDISNENNFDLTFLTITGWYYFTDWENNAALFSKWAGNQGYMFNQNTVGGNKFITYVNGIGTGGSGTYNIGQWYFIVFIVNSTGNYLYVDNTLDVSNAANTITANAIVPNIGAYVAGGVYTRMNASKIAVWNRSLSLQELNALMTANTTNADLYQKQYSTTNNSVVTRYPDNIITNVSLYDIQLNDYLNRTVYNHNTSSNLDADVWQSVLILNATEKITNINLGAFQSTAYDGTYLQYNQSNTSNLTTHNLNAGSYNITASMVGRNHNATDQVNLTIFSTTNRILRFADIELNITARNNITGATINTFTVNVTINGSSYTEEINTTNGIARFYLLNSSRGYNYTFTINAPGFAIQTANIILENISQSHLFQLFDTESVNIRIFDQQTRQLITENVTVQFINEFMGMTNYTITGGLYIANLTVGEYTVWFDAANYTKWAYYITIESGANYSLDAFLLRTNFTNTVTIEFKDKDDGDVLEDVSVAITRISGELITQINVLRTDVTGLIEFTYEPDVEYCFVATLTNYATKEFCLSPILRSEYSANLERIYETLTTVDYYNILVLYDPQTFNEGSNIFEIQFISPTGRFTNYVYALELNGTTLSLDSGTTSTGEVFTDTINIVNPNPTDVATLFYNYTVGTLTKQYVFHIEINVNTTINNTIMSIKRDSKTYGLGVWERSLIVAASAVLGAGIAFFIGGTSPAALIILMVYFFYIYIEFINVWVGVVPIFLTFIYWVFSTK